MKSRTLGLLCLSLLVVLAVPAVSGAATLVFNATTGWQPLSPFVPNPIPLSLSQFNPALGILQKVTLSLDAAEIAGATIENGSANPANVSVSLTGIVQAVAPSALTATAGLALTSGPHALAPNGQESGLPTYNGIGLDFRNLGILPAAGGASNSLTVGLAPYIGPGNIVVNVFGQGGWAFTGTSDADLRISDFRGVGNVKVTYDYDIPEPATLLLLALGGAGLLVRRRSA